MACNQCLLLPGSVYPGQPTWRITVKQRVADRDANHIGGGVREVTSQVRVGVGSQAPVGVKRSRR